MEPIVVVPAVLVAFAALGASALSNCFPEHGALPLPFITTSIHHLPSANLAALILSNRTQCTVHRIQRAGIKIYPRAFC